MDYTPIQHLTTTDNSFVCSFSISCETQDKLKELEKDNTELGGQVSELHSELRLREDQLFEERAKMKKAIALLKQSLYSKEAEVTKLENDQKIFKKELRHLHGRLRAVSIVTSYFLILPELD